MMVRPERVCQIYKDVSGREGVVYHASTTVG